VTDQTPFTAAPADPGEEEAWAELRARWEDPQAHRAFLTRFGDLEALARAGARYRAVLERTPGDAPAAAGRDEVLRKATVLGLAAVPRTVPPAPVSPWVKRGLLASLVLLGAGLAAWAALAFFRSGALR
jgi:hypothetical protein